MPCVRFLCIICHKDHFTRRNCILFGLDKVQKNWVSSIFKQQNFVQIQKIYWKTFIYRYLMYRISNDHKRIWAGPILNNYQLLWGSSRCLCMPHQWSFKMSEIGCMIHWPTDCWLIDWLARNLVDQLILLLV